MLEPPIYPAFHHSKASLHTFDERETQKCIIPYPIDNISEKNILLLGTFFFNTKPYRSILSGLSSLVANAHKMQSAFPRPRHYKSPRAQPNPHPVAEVDLAKMKLLLVLAAVAVALASGSSNKCWEQTFSGSQCAFLFDDGKCNGWKYPIDTGYVRKLPWLKRNDAESVLVKKGCVLTGAFIISVFW